MAHIYSYTHTRIAIVSFLNYYGTHIYNYSHTHIAIMSFVISSRVADIFIVTHIYSHTLYESLTFSITMAHIYSYTLHVYL